MDHFSGMMYFADGKKLSPEQFEYLLLFCNTPRYKRDVEVLKDHPDPLRDAVGLPIGKEGEYFVSSQEYGRLSEEEEGKAKHAELCGFVYINTWLCL